jgi:hypothetical protein
MVGRRWGLLAVVFSLSGGACSSSNSDSVNAEAGDGGASDAAASTGSEGDTSVDVGAADGGLMDGEASVVATCGGASADPAAAATVSTYLDKLAGAAPTGATRLEVTDAILKSCEVFGPSPTQNPGWDRSFCWAHLVAAIAKESGYTTALTNKDAYGMRTTQAGKANDPTVGLLQVRFSSTVRDFATLGKTASLSCAGCTFPSSLASHVKESGDSAFWAVNGPTQNLPFMKNTACNVALGTWYYYAMAMGNGNSKSFTYLDAYCAGKGTSGNLITGLLSHYAGPEDGHGVLANMGAVNGLQNTNGGAYEYVTEIKTSFDSMVSPRASHPFFLKLVPNASRYCR